MTLFEYLAIAFGLLFSLAALTIGAAGRLACSLRGGGVGTRRKEVEMKTVSTAMLVLTLLTPLHTFAASRTGGDPDSGC
jgi:cation transporter-like permease